MSHIAFPLPKLTQTPMQLLLLPLCYLNASKWINITFLLFLIIIMLTTILRIGPLAILESILFSMALIIFYFQTLPICYFYTLSEMAGIFFLIEMYASLCIIKKSPKMTKKYIKVRIQESNLAFYARLAWDNLNIILVLILLYTSLVSDGLLLSSKGRAMAPDAFSEEEKECNFTLFSICLFSELLKQCQFSSEDSMIAWMLYAATTFLISIICVILSKEYYQYCASLHQNRRYSRLNGGINEALLDCNQFKLTKSTVISQQIQHNFGECSICLHDLLQRQHQNNQVKIIKLKCSHHFHEQCIKKWLKVKDHCPFRCNLDQK